MPQRRVFQQFFLVAFLAIALAPVYIFAQEDTSKAMLTIDRIFGSREFTSGRFGQARWEKDGTTYTTTEKSKETKGGEDLVSYDAKSGKRTVLVPASRLIPANDTLPLSIEDYQWSDDNSLLMIFTNSKRVWRRNTKGDYWMLRLDGGAPIKLGEKMDPSSLMFAKFSPDGKMAAYVYKNNVYAENLDDHAVAQLTHDGSQDIVNGTSDWVYEEEFDLRDGFRWSPDSKEIAFWQFDTRGVKEFTMINNTDSLYPRTKTFKYPKAGETNSAFRIGVVPVAGGDIVWMNIPGDPRDTYLPRMEWSPDSKEILMQHLNRLQNRNDVLLGDAKTGAVTSIYTDSDSAWVEVMDDFNWLEKGKEFTWVTEQDGWKHVYRISNDGKEVKCITKGDFDIISVVTVDEKGGWLYYMASPENTAQQYLYRIRMDGKGKPERLTPSAEPGSHSYNMSPTAKWAIHSFSSFDIPSITELVELPEHKTIRTLVDNKELKEKVAALKRKPVEFFKVNIGNGVQLDGWCIKPPDFDPQKSYPVFFYVYGEPAAQTVIDRWGGSQYLWYQMLAQHGYIVASVDNRGTPAPRGRAWRKCIYRKVGVIASADQAGAVKALAQQWKYMDTSRIGIWGWSGGGSMTLNTMFRYPDVYKTGIAVAAVSDLRYYDDIYQERYMGVPVGDDSVYKMCSPISFAKNLKGNLLMVHGSGDDNVHYQNFEAVVNELVANNKLFTMMAYPNRSHGIYEGKGTTRHLYTMMTDYLYKNLPAEKNGRIAE